KLGDHAGPLPQRLGGVTPALSGTAIMLRTAGLLILLCTAGCTDPGYAPQSPDPPAAQIRPARSPAAKSAPPKTSWPQLRGPVYDATSREIGLADHWPPDGPPVLWLRDLGQGYSSFAVASRRL